MLLVGRIASRLLRIYKARRRACREGNACDSWSLLGREGVATKRPEFKSHRRMRSQPRPCFSLLLACSLESGLLRMYGARQHACRLRLLGTPEAFGKGSRRAGEARSERPLMHATETQFRLFQSYQHIILVPKTRNNKRSCGAHRGLGTLRSPGASMEGKIEG